MGPVKRPGVGDTGLLSLRGWVQRILLFHLVCFTWVFFRAPSFGQAIHYLAGLSRFEWRPEYWTAAKFLVAFTLPLFLLDLQLEARSEEYAFERHPEMVRIAFASCLVIGVTLFAANAITAFIYFQF